MGSTTQLWLGVRLLAPQSTYPSILAVFDRASVPLLTPELYHVLRVEAGLPWSGFELNDNYTPLETGLGRSNLTYKRMLHRAGSHRQADYLR